MSGQVDDLPQEAEELLSFEKVNSTVYKATYELEGATIIVYRIIVDNNTFYMIALDDGDEIKEWGADNDFYGALNEAVANWDRAMKDKDDEEEEEYDYDDEDDENDNEDNDNEDDENDNEDNDNEDDEDGSEEEDENPFLYLEQDLADIEEIEEMREEEEEEKEIEEMEEQEEDDDEEDDDEDAI